MSCGLQDVVAFEQLGAPAVLIASNAFTDAADAQSSLLGQPALARVFVPHPIQDRSDDEIRGLAREVVQAALGRIERAGVV